MRVAIWQRYCSFFVTIDCWATRELVPVYQFLTIPVSTTKSELWKQLIATVIDISKTRNYISMKRSIQSVAYFLISTRFLSLLACNWHSDFTKGYSNRRRVFGCSGLSVGMLELNILAWAWGVDLGCLSILKYLASDCKLELSEYM